MLDAGDRYERALNLLYDYYLHLQKMESPIPGAIPEEPPEPMSAATKEAHESMPQWIRQKEFSWAIKDRIGPEGKLRIGNV